MTAKPFTERHIDEFVGRFFNPDAVPTPRSGFQYGQNPFASYLPMFETFQPETGSFVSTGSDFLLRNVMPLSMIRFSTNSGSIYTSKVIEVGENGIGVIGVVRNDLIPTHGSSSQFYVGWLIHLTVGDPAHWSEYADAPDYKEFGNVTYVNPQTVRERIEKKIDDLYTQYGESWVEKSATDIPNNPMNSEVHIFDTHPVLHIEVE
ncbi:hypothetical protein HYW55_06430 [Candidatus Gottesmanbacteria bacterium]|nr:hypothetical protein [Candidatus Gottesmanbacteria bacterium]